MLSSTNSITDIKARLVNDYSYYGYASDAAFISALNIVGADIYNSWFLPNIGSTEYARIQDKDKINLTDDETYLYWAEVFIVCYYFLSSKTSVSGQLQDASDETLRVEGYQYSVGSGSGAGISKGDKSLAYYYEQAFKFFKLAGYNLHSLERTCTIFGDGFTMDRIILNDSSS